MQERQPSSGALPKQMVGSQADVHAEAQAHWRSVVRVAWSQTSLKGAPLSAALQLTQKVEVVEPPNPAVPKPLELLLKPPVPVKPPGPRSQGTVKPLPLPA
jgi:hypothetical protein